jgi:hypothetical protein
MFIILVDSAYVEVYTSSYEGRDIASGGTRTTRLKATGPELTVSRTEAGRDAVGRGNEVMLKWV